MITFAAAVFFMIITPGPGVLSVAGVGSGYGYAAGLRYMLGLFVGTNLVALAVVSGLASVVFSYPYIRSVLLAASVAYLGYLALRIALSGSNITFARASKAPGIIDGIIFQAINPKAYVVNTTLFTGFVIWPESLPIEILVKFAIINAIWVPIHMLWTWAGVTLKRLALSTRQQKTINILMAMTLMGVVVLAALG